MGFITLINKKTMEASNKVSFSYWVLYNMLLFVQHFTGVNFFKKHLYSIYLYVIEKSLEKRVKKVFHTQHQLKYFPIKAIKWKAIENWSFEFFKDNYGQEKVLINTIPGLTDKKGLKKGERLSLKKLIQEIRKGSKQYLKLNDIVNKHKKLQSDLDLKWLKSLKPLGSFGETFFYFMGAKGTKTPLHCEFPSTVYIQIEGVKKWFVYPPEDRIILNPKMDRRTYFFSDFDPSNPDLKRFPYFKYASKKEFILHPGDVLIVPPFYWHYVENLTDSIGVAYKFSNIKTSLMSSKLLTLLTFLATKPFLLYSFIMNRVLKKDIVSQ